MGSSSAHFFFWGFVQMVGGLGATVLAASLATERLHGFSWAEAGEALGFVVVLFYVVFGFSNLRRAYRTRASDALFEDGGLRIEGGPHHGTYFNYAMLGPPHLTFWKQKEGKRRNATQLVLTRDAPGAKRPPIVLADSIHEGETDSLRSLVSTLGAIALPVAKQGPPGAAVLCCSACGGPLVPVDRAIVTCQFCSRANAMPEKLREQIRAAEVLTLKRPRLEKLVRKLLQQPGAVAVNRLALAIVVLTALTPLISIGATVYQYTAADSVRYDTLIGLIELPFFAALGATLLLRARVVDRFALGLLTRDFSAKRAESGQLVCRRCGGPLSSGRDAALARCVYCDSDNVLGVDLRQSARQLERQQPSLEAVLAARTRRRLGWTAGAALSTFVMLHAVKLLTQGFEQNRATDPTKLGYFYAQIGRFDRSSVSPAASRRGRIAFVEVADPRGGDGNSTLRLPDVAHGLSSLDEAKVLERGSKLRDPAWVGEEELLYVVSAGDDHASLRQIDVRGGESREIFAAEDIERPSASEDGARIAFAEREGMKWYILLLSGNDQRRLGEGRMPALHSTGDDIAFIRDVDGLPKPFVLDLKDAAATPEALFEPNPWRYADPTWAACSAFVVAATNANWDRLRSGKELDTWNLIALDRSSGEVFTLTQGNAAARHPSWSGPRIYLDHDGQPGGLHTIRELVLGGDFLHHYDSTCPG